MASVGEAQALLDELARVRQQIEAIDDPARDDLLVTWRSARTEAEAVLARAEAEAARVLSGVGAAPRYRRLR
jgi:Spy/CpxP family protein refolding chaperone